jgi:hypothetical protein
MDILAPFMMWASCSNQTCTKTCISFLYIFTSILNFYWGTQAIWVKSCLLCDSLGGMNLPLNIT